jgi:hypothetical protein
MNDQPGGSNGDKFHPLVHQNWCLCKVRPLYPMCWVISDMDHSSVDPDFQDGVFSCLTSVKHDNLIIAQSGCQPMLESDRSCCCWTVDEAIIRHLLHRGLVRAMPTQLFGRRQKDHT